MKYSMKFILSILIISILFSSSVHGADYSEWIFPPEPEGTVHGTGFVPSKEEYPAQPLRIMPFSSFNRQYPAGVSYNNMDLTIATINQHQSPVKDQGRTNLCWSFASMGAIEASKIKNGGAVNAVDLSEINAAHALSPAEGNSIWGHNSRTSANDGGNAYQVMLYAMRGAFSGFVKQDDDDKILTSPLANRPLEQTEAERRSYIVSGAYRLSAGKASVNEIKAAVSKYGAVTTSMVGDPMDKNSWNADNAAYYLKPSSAHNINHLVLIVGWDDDYPRMNFSSSSLPDNNGAWLVKNSWGTGWGKSGYFWISYEDKYVGSDCWFFEPVEAITDEDLQKKIYDYNATVDLSRYDGGVMYGTNIFKTGNKAEKLTQVRVYVNYAPQSNIPIYFNSDTSKVYASEDTEIATFNADYIGYYTINIDENKQPTIAANTEFAISMKNAAGFPAMKLRSDINPKKNLSYIISTKSGSVTNETDLKYQEISSSGFAVPIKAVTVPKNPSDEVKVVKWTDLTANNNAAQQTESLTLTFNEGITLTKDDITIWGATKGDLTGSGNSYTLKLNKTTPPEVTVVIKTNQKNVVLSHSIKTVAVQKGPPTPVTWKELYLDTNGGTAGTADTKRIYMEFSDDPEFITEGESVSSSKYITITGASMDRLVKVSGKNGKIYYIDISNITVGQGENVKVELLIDPPGVALQQKEKEVAIHRNKNINWVSANTVASTVASTFDAEVTLSFSGAVHDLDADDITVTNATRGTLTEVDNLKRTYKLQLTNISIDNIDDVTVEIENDSYTISPAERTLNIAFPSSAIQSVAVKDVTENLSYTEGDILDLTGLTVELTYFESESIKKVVGVEDFSYFGVTTEPSNGTVLKDIHNETAINIKAGSNEIISEMILTVISISSGINYNTEAVMVGGKLADGAAADGFSIDLTAETVTLPSGYIVKAYSVDGGNKWKKITSKPFDNAAFAKLLNKDLTLVLSDKEISKETKKPADGAIVVEFEEINKRPKMKKYTVNYLIGADPTGETPGSWVLTEGKGGTTSVKSGIEVAIANGKVPDSNGYGYFHGEDGSAGGIPIAAYNGSKVTKTVYYIREAAKVESGVYTPASKAKKISVVSEQKPTKYKVNVKKGIIKYKANTYLAKGSEEAEYFESKGELNVTALSGKLYFWTGATAKKPASAKQEIALVIQQQQN